MLLTIGLLHPAALPASQSTPFQHPPSRPGLRRPGSQGPQQGRPVFLMMVSLLYGYTLSSILHAGRPRVCRTPGEWPMNGRSSLLLALGLVALSGPSAQAQFGPRRGDQQEAARYGWLASLEEGQAQARKTGRPLMVVLRCVP